MEAIHAHAELRSNEEDVGHVSVDDVQDERIGR
jgi:hypothetical protein